MVEDILFQQFVDYHTRPLSKRDGRLIDVITNKDNKLHSCMYYFSKLDHINAVQDTFVIVKLGE